jgi:O-antigen ligase
VKAEPWQGSWNRCLVPAMSVATGVLDPGGSPESASVASTRTGSRAIQLAWLSLCGLVLVAPFEMLRPLLRVPGQSLSNVEAILVVSVLVWSIAAITAGGDMPWRSPLAAPLFTLAAVAAVTAGLAPAFHANALHMAARLGLLALLVVMVGTTVTTHERLRRTLVVSALAGVVVSGLILLEYLGLAELRAFHPGAALVGSQMRASGPLQYPTAASMFVEICFALTLGLLAGSQQRQQRWAAAVLAAALLLMGEAIILTFTRAGLLTSMISLVIAAASAASRGRTEDLWLLGLIGAGIAAAVLTSRSAEVLRLRMTTEGQGSWYRASFDPPSSLALVAGRRVRVPMRLRNDGRITWTIDGPQPFHVSYHWLSTNGRVVQWEGVRTRLDAPVPPSATVEIAVDVLPLSVAGRYQLAWDIEHVNRLWFSTEPDARRAWTDVTVTGAAAGDGDDVPSLGLMPPTAVRPGRMELWSLALQLWAERPLIGIGIDNFRLLSGSNERRADRRVHTNNMYLELVVGTGLLGVCTLLWLALRTRPLVWQLLAPGAVAEAAGVAAAVVAVLVHGLVDTFLGFTPLYILIALAFGLAVSASRLAYDHAYRV